MMNSIREYFADGINPIVMLELRKARRSGLFLFYVGYAFGGLLMTLYLCAAPALRSNWLQDDYGFFVGFLAYVSGLACFGASLTQSRVSCSNFLRPNTLNGDETFFLIPIPYLERFHSGYQLGLFASLPFVIISLPLAVLVSVFSGYFAFLFIPLIQLAVIYAALMLKTLVYGFVTPFSNYLDQGLLIGVLLVFCFSLVSGIFLCVFIVERSMFHELIRSYSSLFPWAIALLFAVLNAWTVSAYLLICFHLTRPKQKVLSVLGYNLLLAVPMALLAAALTVLVMLMC